MNSSNQSISFGKLFVFGLLFLFALNLQGQKRKRDSVSYRIKHLISTNKFSTKDSTHLDLLANYSKYYRFINNDSLYTISNRVLKLSREINYKQGEIKALENIGLFYSDKGNYEKALQNYKKALIVARKIKDNQIRTGYHK